MKSLPIPAMLGAVLPALQSFPPTILDRLEANGTDERRYQLEAATHDEDEGGVIGVKRR